MSFECDLVLTCDADVSISDVAASDAWHTGPFIHEYSDHRGRAISTDAVTRSTNFPTALGQRLFGKSSGVGQSVRFSTASLDQSWGQHSSADIPAEIVLQYAEVLVSSTRNGSDQQYLPGVLSLHFKVRAKSRDQAVEATNLLARERGAEAGSNVHGTNTYAGLRQFHSDICEGMKFADDNDSETESTVYSMILVELGNNQGMDSEAFCGRVAFSVASGQTYKQEFASQASVDASLERMQWLSKSWSALFLRHGAAFVIHAAEDDPFRRYMEVYFRTLYTDALMLVRLQIQLIRRAESQCDRLLDASVVGTDNYLGDVSGHFRALSKQIELDCSRYWMRRSDYSSGRSISLVHRIQDALGFLERLEALDAQVGALSRISRTDLEETNLEAQNRLTRVVALIGSVAIPLSFSADLFQLLKLPVNGLSISLLAVCMVALGGVVWGWLKYVSKPPRKTGSL